MADYSTLIGVINEQIKANGNQEITGPVLNAVLRSIVSGMSEGALFAGIATPITNPLAYDGDVFYIATIPGTYSNFGVIVPRGRIGVLYNTSNGWAVSLINTYYTINVDTLMQDSPSSDDIDEAIGGFANLVRAIISGAPFFGKSVSGGNSTVAIVQVKQLADNEVRVVMLNTGTIELTVNEVIITNTSGTLTKTVNTHAVLTENMVVNNLESDEATLPLSAAQGKVLSEEVNTTYQKKNDNALSTTDKTVVGAINENTSDVSRLDIASTQPDIEEVDLDEGAEEGTFWHTNGTKKAEPNLNCKTVQLEKGDMLFVTGYANKNVYIIAQVNSDNTAITSTKLSVPGKENTGQVLKYSFVAAEKCTVAVSYYKAFKHEAFIVRAEVNTAVARLAGSMTALHAIYESNGAVYNENTGYWELNGLTDLTEDEMYDIYLWTKNLINQPELDNALSYAPIRTTFAPEIQKIYKQANGVSINQMATFCTNLEIFNINSISDSQMSLKAVGTAAHKAFAGCTKLREIKQILYLSNLVTGNIFTSAFSNCQQLRKVRILGLKQKVSFEDSPLISYESLNYIVANAANTAAITITVHDTTYSYLTGAAQPTEEVGGTTEEWQALVTAAAEKQITFITAE